MVIKIRSIAFGFCLLALSGCAATTYAHRTGEHRVGDAIGEPFRDTGWTRENPPELLIRAAEAPYALPGDAECSTILSEISALDLVLGPDLDSVEESEDQSDTDASGLLSGAIGSIVGLPYRSIVRRLSGASGRERVLREAIFAGMVRRAYLKGVARAACAPLPAEAAPPSPPPEFSPSEASDSQPQADETPPA